jgi:hypothetical protein
MTIHIQPALLLLVLCMGGQAIARPQKAPVANSYGTAIQTNSAPRAPGGLSSVPQASVSSISRPETPGYGVAFAVDTGTGDWSACFGEPTLRKAQICALMSCISDDCSIVGVSDTRGCSALATGTYMRVHGRLKVLPMSCRHAVCYEAYQQCAVYLFFLIRHVIIRRVRHRFRCGQQRKSQERGLAAVPRQLRNSRCVLLPVEHAIDNSATHTLLESLPMMFMERQTAVRHACSLMDYGYHQARWLAWCFDMYEVQ